MRRLLATAVLFLGLPAAAQGVLGPDDVYVLAETAPAPVGGMSAVSQALVYPDAALEAEAEGTVVLTLIVDPDGSVRDLVVARAPHPALGEAALAAVASLPFVPGTVGGEAVPTRLTLPIRFVLPEVEEVAWADQPAEPIGGWERLLSSVAWPDAYTGPGREISFLVVADIAADGSVTRSEIEDLEVTGGRVIAIPATMGAAEAQAVMSEQRTRPQTEAHLGLREAVLAAIAGASFTPEIRDGEAVAGRATYAYRGGATGSATAANTPQPVGGWVRLVDSIQWPDDALALRAEGVFTLLIDVDAAGMVTNAEVVEADLVQDEGRLNVINEPRRDPSRSLRGVDRRATLSSTRAAMERAILREVERATFIPQMRDGRAEATQIRVRLPFTIRG